MPGHSANILLAEVKSVSQSSVVRAVRGGKKDSTKKRGFPIHSVLGGFFLAVCISIFVHQELSGLIFYVLEFMFCAWEAHSPIRAVGMCVISANVCA